VSKPTIADLPERYRLQIARQLAQAKRPKTISREPDPAPEPKVKRAFDRAEVFLRALEVRGLPRPEREWKFEAKRRWRFDYAWPERMIALEVEGGVWTGGRHTRGAGFLKDVEKYNRAAVLGWRLLRVTPDKLVSTGTFEMLREIFGLRESNAGVE
jgi:hypothetical protein